MKPNLAAESDQVSDAALVGLSRSGDREAFGRIVARYQSPICALAYSACGSVARSEDIAQEIFITAWRQLDRLEEPASFKAWLYGIARNLIHNAFRQLARNPLAGAELLDESAEPTSAADEPDAQMISKEEEHILWRVLSGLPEIYREPMVLFYRQNESIPVVAEALAISEEAVRQRLSRGRALLNDRVMKVIQTGLRRSGPAEAFSAVVVAALPLLAVKTAQAATVGTAISTAAASADGVTGVGAGGGLAVIKFLSMTKLLVGVAGAVLVAGMAIPLAVQHQSLVRLRAENDQLQQASQAASDQTAQVEALTAENRRLSNLVARAAGSPSVATAPTSAELQLRSEVTRLKKQALTNAGPAKPGGAIGDLLKNPGMKEVLQQTYDVMIQKEYTPLFAQLHLPADQAAAFKDLLVEQMNQAGEHADSMLSGDPVAFKQAADAVEAEKAASDAKIQQLLGDDAYGQYQAYEKTLSQRMTLSNFEDQLGSGANALSPDQERQLLQTMVEELDPAKLAAGTAGGSGAATYSDAVNRAAALQTQANQRIVARATNYLSPDQVDSLQKFLTKQVSAGQAMEQMLRGGAH
jgi:RNA polymerase sigma factor (sigma-70 family)